MCTLWKVVSIYTEKLKKGKICIDKSQPIKSKNGKLQPITSKNDTLWQKNKYDKFWPIRNKSDKE